MNALVTNQSFDHNFNALDATLATTAAHGREVPEILAALRELHRVMREVAR